MTTPNLIDPLRFAGHYWPDVRFYRQQEEVIYSVVHNKVTIVPAGNKLGKDFVSGFIALWWFCSRKPARVVTTSVKMDQLEDVLWGEIRRFLKEAKHPLPLQYNHMKIRQVEKDGTLNPNSELVGQVSNTKEGLLGRHSTQGFKPVPGDVPRTLVIFDEASGVDDDTWQSVQTWAQRILVIGNPFPCSNFFKREVKAGDLPRPCPRGELGCPICKPPSAESAPGSGPAATDTNPAGSVSLAPHGHLRKVIKIRAEDSPNVRLARSQIARGEIPTGEQLVPGCKGWEEYQEQRATWDPILQCVGLDAEFYEGSEVLLFPPDRLTRAEQVADELDRLYPIFPKGDRVHPEVCRGPFALGCDTAEGGDVTSWTIGDDKGIVEKIEKRTADTSVIVPQTISLMKKYRIDPGRVCFDLGGGGKQHVDRLHQLGIPVRAVGFGEAPTHQPKRGKLSFKTRMDSHLNRSAYVNRRAEMFKDASDLLDPSSNPDGYGIPRKYRELRRQLAPIPLEYDPEGKVKLMSKNKRGKDSKEPTLVDLLGCSPDEADSFVLMVHALVTDAPAPARAY